jgi:hypothetical protein
MIDPYLGSPPARPPDARGPAQPRGRGWSEAMSDAGRTGWQFIGAHPWRLEPPGFLYCSPRGDVSDADVRQLLAALVECTGPGELPIALINITEMGELLPEARKAASAPDRQPQSFTTLFVGATFTQRMMIKLIDKAYHLLTRSPSAAPTLFFDAEEEARAWIAQRWSELPVLSS